MTNSDSNIGNRRNKFIAAAMIASTSFGAFTPAYGKTELPSLEKCFNAIRKEVDGGESLTRIKNDIDTHNWQDLILFTREYDAGFRGGVLKNAWKQLDEDKRKGIDISNSFTFDLIALNKAARNQDEQDALHRLDQVKEDLVNFLALDPAKQ
eukprot:gene3651-7278_t